MWVLRCPCKVFTFTVINWLSKRLCKQTKHFALLYCEQTIITTFESTYLNKAVTTPAEFDVHYSIVYLSKRLFLLLWKFNLCQQLFSCLLCRCLFGLYCSIFYVTGFLIVILFCFLFFVFFFLRYFLLCRFLTVTFRIRFIFVFGVFSCLLVLFFF